MDFSALARSKKLHSLGEQLLIERCGFRRSNQKYFIAPDGQLCIVRVQNECPGFYTVDVNNDRQQPSDIKTKRIIFVQYDLAGYIRVWAREPTDQQDYDVSYVSGAGRDLSRITMKFRTVKLVVEFYIRDLWIKFHELSNARAHNLNSTNYQA